MSEAPLISIVDDDALARDGTAALVKSLGYNVITFNSRRDIRRRSGAARGRRVGCKSDVNRPPRLVEWIASVRQL